MSNYTVENNLRFGSCVNCRTLHIFLCMLAICLASFENNFKQNGQQSFFVCLSDVVLTNILTLSHAPFLILILRRFIIRTFGNLKQIVVYSFNAHNKSMVIFFDNVIVVIFVRKWFLGTKMTN